MPNCRTFPYRECKLKKEMEHDGDVGRSGGKVISQILKMADLKRFLRAWLREAIIIIIVHLFKVGRTRIVRELIKVDHLELKYLHHENFKLSMILIIIIL